MRLEIRSLGTTRFVLGELRTETLSGRTSKWRRDPFASRASHHGDHPMPLKKPLPLLVPQRARTIPPSFAWIDHRLRSEGILPRLRPEDLGLYLFLALAADQQGLSCWRLDRIAKTVPCFDRHTLWDAHQAVRTGSDRLSPVARRRTGRLLPGPLRPASPRTVFAGVAASPGTSPTTPGAPFRRILKHCHPTRDATSDPIEFALQQRM